MTYPKQDDEWIEKHNEAEAEKKIKQMKEMKAHIEEANIFRQVCANSPNAYLADYDLLWLTWCIRRTKNGL